MGKSALITGSRGFLGKYLKNKLKILNYEIHEFEGDIRKINDFNKSIDVVFHLAAKTKGSEFIKDKSNCFDINITGTQQVLNYCIKNDARLVFISTSAVYKFPDSDTLIKENYPLQPKSSYAISKYIAENLCSQYFASFGLPVTILRIFNLYGIGQEEPYLAPYIINRLVKGKVIKLRMPEAIRDLIYVTDAVEAIAVAGMNQKKQLNIYNIGSGRNIRVIDFLHTAEQIFNKKANIKVIGNKYEEVGFMVADNNKAIKELKLKINTELKEGIKKIKESLD